MLGTKMVAAALLLTPPTPEGRGLPSLRPKPNPKTENLYHTVIAIKKKNARYQMEFSVTCALPFLLLGSALVLVLLVLVL